MERRNATAAVIGAGDFIGGAIARKFAAEGFTVFVGRRNGDKLAPLVQEIEAAGGRIRASALDARKEEDNGETLVALAQTDEVKEGLRANTERSVELGAFGSPTSLVGDEIFFGKDRLRDVEEAIAEAHSLAAPAPA